MEIGNLQITNAHEYKNALTIIAIQVNSSLRGGRIARLGLGRPARQCKRISGLQLCFISCVTAMTTFLKVNGDCLTALAPLRERTMLPRASLRGKNVGQAAWQEIRRNFDASAPV